MLKNTPLRYGLISKSLHWLSALTVVSLFILGYWMIDLDYYSQWYQTAPHWHQSIGFILFSITLIRLFWRFTQAQPKPVMTHSNIEKKSAKLIHLCIYILLLSIMIAGYLISTADGRVIEIFTWFEISSLGELFLHQEDIAGNIHKYSAYLLMILSAAHALAAIKHHFIDKDKTLARML